MRGPSEPAVRVVAVGQPYAGDDAVGLRVVERLAQSPPPGAEVTALRSPLDLLALLEQPGEMIVIDALAEPARAGRVQVLGLEALDARASLSSHGLSAPAAVELAAELYGARAARVRFVAISVAPRAGPHRGLSPAAERASAVAEARARQLVAELRGAPSAAGSEVAAEPCPEPEPPAEVERHA